ncbi:MAG: twin-arginine translocase subunit TatC [Archaeoglobaceae archaeon]|nr:twin-arginine translocase subunit TatC [Archaeoglobaceae archaeon]MDW8128375.1 twin-arginine translocase subunit TatC [Archaeoglobaceae archaeon]
MEAKDWARILVEIRKNLLRISIIVILATLISFPFTPKIIQFLLEEFYPEQELTIEEIGRISEELSKTLEVLRNNTENKSAVLEELKRISRLISPYGGPIVLTPLEALVLSLKISIAIGIASSIPYVLILASKALKSRGLLRTKAFHYAISSFLFFLLGTIYGFYIVKFIIHFLHGITKEQGVIPLYNLAEFVNFVLFMIVLFGFFFQIPVVMVFLVRNHILKYETLKYYRRHCYLLFFILSAIATPTVDIFTQTMLALPMIFLFEFGLLFSKVISKTG